MKNIENKKLPQILSFNMCKGPKKIWHHFGLFLSLFLAFHLKFLQLCKKPPSYISGTHQLLFPLVNNGQNWCQKLCKIFSPLLILQGECAISLISLLRWIGGSRGLLIINITSRVRGKVSISIYGILCKGGLRDLK
jgi:hypothetical protein